MGLVSQTDANTAQDLVKQTVTLVGEVVTLVGTVIAFVKSLPSSTTTLNVPKATIDTVMTVDGKTLAGPANSLPDGTVIAAATTGSDAAPPTT